MATLKFQVDTIVHALEEGKATDIQVFNTSRRSSLFSRVILATASSARQANALAHRVCDALLAAHIHPLSTEGEENSEWVLVDVGSVVLHVMQPSIRNHYCLEELWGSH